MATGPARHGKRRSQKAIPIVAVWAQIVEQVSRLPRGTNVKLGLAFGRGGAERFELRVGQRLLSAINQRFSYRSWSDALTLLREIRLLFRCTLVMEPVCVRIPHSHTWPITVLDRAAVTPRSVLFSSSAAVVASSQARALPAK
jgi:hypothetical protein